jgi:uncharacterized protein YjdB
MHALRSHGWWTRTIGAITLALIAGCGGGDGGGPVTPPPDPITVSISPAAVANLEVGGVTQLSATVSGGASSAVRTVTWTSSADAIIRVSASGQVTAIAPGQAVITATADADRTRSAQVTVIANAPRVTAISLNAASGTLLIGQTTTVTAAITATGTGTNTRARFTSSSPAIATVTTADGLTGTVTAVARGDVQITATSELDATRTASVTIRVSEVRAASITVTAPIDSVALGATLPLTATVRDAGGAVLTGRPITWISSSSVVATVSSTGVVSTVSPGVVTITASVPVETGSAEVLTGSFRVRVVSGLRLSLTPRELRMRPTDVLPITPTVVGGAPTIDRTVEFVSRTASVATVSASGGVTAVGIGFTRIVARMRADTLVRDSITVSVLDPCSLAFTHTLGAVTNGTYTTASCRVDLGGQQIAFQESIVFLATATSAVSYSFQSTSARTDFLVPYPEGGGAIWIGGTIQPGAQPLRGVMYLRPGRYFLDSQSRNLGVGTFQFETTVDPDPNTLCGQDRYAMVGAQFTAALGGSCTSLIISGMTLLDVGARIQVTASAVAYPVRLELIQLNADNTLTLLASGTATGPGQSTQATFANFGVRRNWNIRLSSPQVGAIGPAQVTIQP